jgi:hypothetical protein
MFTWHASSFQAKSSGRENVPGKVAVLYVEVVDKLSVIEYPGNPFGTQK